MTNNHENIPMLAKLEINYVCDKCRARITLGSFYKAIDEVIIAASVEDGKLICPGCRDKPLKDKR